uniref:Prostate and testis expressed 2 n=1 Tax=Myotis lucifugus TaxID=59463 RepID=G1QFA5_MYOLU
IFQVLLLGVFIVLFMDEGDRVLTTKWVRFCNDCEIFDGQNCNREMKNCWKIHTPFQNRSCRTDHFYFYDRLTGRYLYRYTTLSCETCEEGMFQVFHDLLRETYCCTDDDRCNDPNDIPDITREYVSHDVDRIVKKLDS